MAKNSLIDILIGIDQDKSSAEISAGLNQVLQDVLKPIMISLELDPTSISNIKDSIDSMARDMQHKLTMARPEAGVKPTTTTDLSSQFIDPSNMKRITEFLKEQGIHFKGMQVAVSGATQDLDGFVKVGLKLSETDGLIRKVTIGMNDLTSGSEIQVLSSTLENNFNKVLEESIKKLQQTGAELTKIEQRKKSGMGTDSDTGKKAELESSFLTQQVSLYKQIEAAKQQGLVLSTEQATISERIQAIANKPQQAQQVAAEAAQYEALNQDLREYEGLIKEVARLKTNPPKTQEESEILAAISASETRIEQLKQQDFVYDKLKTKAQELAALEASTKENTAAEQRYKKALAVLVEMETAQKRMNELELEHAKQQLRTTPEGNADRLKIISELEQKIASLKQQFADLPGNSLPTLVEKFNNITNSVKKTQEQVQSTAASMKSLDDAIGKTVKIQSQGQTNNIMIPKQAIDEGIPALERYTKMVHGADSSITALKVSTKNLTGITHEFTVKQNESANVTKISKYAYDENLQTMRLMGEETRLNANRMLAWSEQLGVAIKRMFAWGVAAQLLYGSLRKIKEGFSFLIELDKNLTQVAIVQGNLRSSTKGLGSSYTTLAAEMRKSVKEISEVNMELIRQGLTMEESTSRMKVILKLSSSALISTDQSLQLVTSGVNAMGVAAERVADVMLKASMVSASDVEGLGDAFTKTASSASNAGLEIEQVTAMLATMKEVTQEADTNLGTSLKTILARFHRVNEETGDLNEDLNDVETAFKSVNIAFRESNGDIRNVFDILTDLNEIWPELTQTQRDYIATQAAGTRMQNRFFAIVGNFNKVLDINNQLLAAGGTLNQSYAIYLESVEAAQMRLTAAIEKFWIEMMDTDSIKLMYNALAGIVELLNNMGGINVLAGIFGAAAVAATPFFKAWITAGDLRKQTELDIANIETRIEKTTNDKLLLEEKIKISKGKQLTQDETSLRLAKEKLVVLAKEKEASEVHLAQLGGGVIKTAEGERNIGAAAKGTGVLAEGFKKTVTVIKSMAVQMAVIAAIGIAISLTFKLIDDYVNRVANSMRALDEAIERVNKAAESNSMIDQLEQLQALNEAGAENMEQIAAAQRELAQINPDWIDYYDPETFAPMVRDTSKLKEHLQEVFEIELALMDLKAGEVEKNLQKAEEERDVIQESIKLEEKLLAISLENKSEHGIKAHQENLLKLKNLEFNKMQEIQALSSSIAKREAMNRALAQKQVTDELKNTKAIYDQREKIAKSTKKGTAENRGALAAMEVQADLLAEQLGSRELANLVLSSDRDIMDSIIRMKDTTLKQQIDELAGVTIISAARKQDLDVLLLANKAQIDGLRTAAKQAEIMAQMDPGNTWFKLMSIAASKALKEAEADYDILAGLVKDLKIHKLDRPKKETTAPTPKEVAPYKTQLDELHNLLNQIAIKEKEISDFSQFKNFASEKEYEYILIQENALLEDKIQLHKKLSDSYEGLLNGAMNHAADLSASHPHLITLDKDLKMVTIDQKELAKVTDDELKESLENAALAVDKYRDAWQGANSTIAEAQAWQWKTAEEMIKRAIDVKIAELDTKIAATQRTQEASIDRVNKQLEEQQKYYDNQIKLKEEQIALIDKQIAQEERLISLKDKTDQLTKLQTDQRYTYITAMGEELYTFDRMQYDQLWREREELIRQYKNDDLKAALQKEIDNLKAAREQKKVIADKQIEDIKASDQAEIDNLKAAQEALKELRNKGLADIQEGLDEFRDKFGAVVGDIEVLAAKIAAAIALMNKQPEPPRGGSSWDSTYGSVYDEGNNTGKTFDLTDASGKTVTIPEASQSYINSVKDKMGVKYHDGGIVGGQSFNPQTEQVAKLLLGEVVLNEEHLKNVPNILQNLASSILGAQIDPTQLIKVLPTQTNSTSTEYHLHGVTINTNDATDFFKQIDHLVMARAR